MQRGRSDSHPELVGQVRVELRVEDWVIAEQWATLELLGHALTDTCVIRLDIDERDDLGRRALIEALERGGQPFIRLTMANR